MLHLFHINDVLAYNDTSRDRLRTQYECIANQLNITEYTVHYAGSPYGESDVTGSQAYSLIQSIQSHYPVGDRFVILVNNANRAKHKNSSNAKGSRCLWATILGPHDIHVVGVDDDVFELFEGCIDQLRCVDDIIFNHHTQHDISQGSQFRSLEFFPIVQCLVATNLVEEDGYALVTKSYSLSFNTTTEPVVIDRVYCSENEKRECSCLFPVINHTYLDGYTDISSLQILGQKYRFYNQRGIEWNRTHSDSLVDVYSVSKYSTQREEKE